MRILIFLAVLFVIGCNNPVSTNGGSDTVDVVIINETTYSCRIYCDKEQVDVMLYRLQTDTLALPDGKGLVAKIGNDEKNVKYETVRAGLVWRIN